MTFYGMCEKCQQPVQSPQTPAFPITGFEVPRAQGGQNHVRNRQRVPGQVWHEVCLPRERIAAEQESMAF
jgi:hypothetical protein